MDRGARTITIIDVAAKAGVSVPTVSRVLTGAARVSEKRRRLVLDAIEELGFRPSAAARMLASRRTKAIGVLAGDTSHYGYAETIRGIELAARAEGHTVSITLIESADEDAVERSVALTLTQALSGVIVLKFDPAGEAALERLPSDLPVVALSGVPSPNFPQVLMAEEEAAAELTTRLLELGHRTVHHVRIPPGNHEDGRTTGWRRALTDAGAPVPAVLDATWEPISGVRIGRALAATPDMTAVLCGNDEIAMGVMRGLGEMGLRVPADVSVVGFDDHPLAQIWMPSLTTARQDFADLGARGVKLLMQAADQTEEVGHSVAHPTVIWRESAAPPRVTSEAGE
ncbi:LacI family DNA-binding transcriptional regulator [Mycetocola sp. 2940]|uniref:LacI family DNA-binding transcriptional regulator n=1 Tax=Mycetocola sp. 2940 TaxID=3156452 RepID=UPI00339A9E40